VLLVVGVIWTIGLSANGWANSFYSAAVQAGSVSWKAFFFGASDAAASITVDKPPAALWAMALSVRVFGLSSWSILIPQVLMGLGTIAVVWTAARRWFSPLAAFVAAAVLATTPAAVLMFRFNNPDALLTLLLTLATYFVLRGCEDGRMRWMVWAGALVGLGFLTKQLQAFLVLPVFAAYLAIAPVPLWRRVRDAALALAAMVASAGWWVAAVELWPASSRPYIGGSQHNSFLELTFGYNGLGRLSGDETGSVGGTGGAGGGMWGSTGISRLFDGEFGGQISWLAPAAFILLVIGLVVTGRRPRTDLQRASLVLWGGSLVVIWAVFSFMSGIFHAYYTVALAAPLAVTVGIGVHLLWERRCRRWVPLTGSGIVLVSGLWAFALLRRSTGWMTWLPVSVLALSILAAAGLAIIPWMAPAGRRPLSVAAVILTVLGLAAGPSAYSADTLLTSHSGSIVTAGPAVTGSTGFGGRGGQGRFGGQAGQGGQGGQGFFGGQTEQGGQTGPDGSGGQVGQTGQPGQPGQGGFGGQGTPGMGAPPDGNGGSQPGGIPPTGAEGGLPGVAGGGQGVESTGRQGGGNGLLNGSSVSSQLTALLLKDADDYTWVAAATGSQTAASFQLATRKSVMPIGGFNGSDPSPTLKQFQRLVAAHKIHYYIGSGGSGMTSRGGSDAAQRIATWVAAHYSAQTVAGTTVYDLTDPK
jgi:4-amino-4-deoxy-L-arabinose transferase-like glycosyltransferase